MKIFDAEEIIIDGIAYKAIAYRNPMRGETYLAPCSSGVFTCHEEFCVQRLVVERVEPEYITPTQEDVVKYNFPVVDAETSYGWSERILLAVYQGQFYTVETEVSGTLTRHSRCRMVNPKYKKA